MKLPIVFHDLAERELNEAADYYERARPGLGGVFLSALERATRHVSGKPLAGRVVAPGLRWWLVPRFPYAVVYRVSDDHIRILAVPSTKRRPFYWRRRR